MTIAAGFVCRDGIVLCADSQEESSGFKWPVKKLIVPRSMMGKLRIMVAGAGFGPAIDSTSQKIMSRISMSLMPQDRALEEISWILREVYEKDLPLHPYYHIDPNSVNFSLLIALRGEDGYTGLFSTTGSLISKVDFFDVIGSGEVIKYFAHMMYRKTSWDKPILNISEGTVLAAYLIHLAKQQVNSIGGQSQIATLNGEGDIQVAGQWDIPRWESFFSDFQMEMHKVMLDCADPSTNQSDFESRLDGHVMSLKAAKAGLIREKEEWTNLWESVQAAVDKMTKG